MKQFIQAFLAFFCILFVLNVSYAQTSTNATCVPVNMVNPSTVVPCGNGYTGSKFKRTVVTCPGNQSTQTDYDTSQCVALSNYNPPSKCRSAIVASIGLVVPVVITATGLKLLPL